MVENNRILMVDDEPFNLDLLEQELDALDCATASVNDGHEALRKLSYGFTGILLSDIKMPRMDGIELMKRAREIDPDLPVILITAHGDISMAVQAMREGAYDFIERPYDGDRLRDSVTRALNNRALALENRALRAELAVKAGLDARILGNSPLIVELRRTIINVADTDVNVLIRGETGTGKELVARGLHELSRRADHHFVAVNCGAIPESLFESELFGHEKGAHSTATTPRPGKIEYAHRGTLFLDEIESMPLNLQVGLLRVLQEREVQRLGSNDPVPVDFRMIAATQLDLGKAVESGEFREDLYYRLNVAEVHVPPLRDRREDIPLLFESFASELAAAHEREIPSLSRAELQELMAHRWPGNVRELRNIAERRVLGLSRGIGSVAALTKSLGAERLSLRDQLDAFEKCILQQELATNRGNIESTGQALGIPVRTLNDRMRKHDLARKDYL